MGSWSIGWWPRRSAPGGVDVGRPLCVIVGLLSTGAGLWGLLHWWPLAVLWMKAAGPLVLLVGGLIAVLAGAMEFRDPGAR